MSVSWSYRESVLSSFNSA